MSTSAEGYVIEPLDPTRHDRTAFSCGVAQVDNYLKRTANKLAKAGNVRVFVMTNETGRIVGFYAVNAHAIDYRDLPDRFARTRPSHGSIPAAFISMMGRDTRDAGQGIGPILLADALKRIVRAADSLGIAVVALDVFDCGDASRVARRTALYERFGFIALPSMPRRMILPVSTIQTLINEP